MTIAPLEGSKSRLAGALGSSSKPDLWSSGEQTAVSGVTDVGDLRIRFPAARKLPLLRQRRDRRPERCQLRLDVGFVRSEKAFDVSGGQLAGVDQGRFQGAQAGSHL